MYHFSDTQSHNFYGRNFYEILDECCNVVAFSEAKFNISPKVRFCGNAKIFKSAKILGGEIRGGVILGGEIRGGEIHGGVIRGGEICGGVIRGGVICGGVIRGGEICGGEILGGEIHGGEIHGGVIRGGEICGGVIRGGVIWGGEILGGIYKKTLLQIQGSRHFCYATPTDTGRIELGIGCCIHPILEWKENYIAIGESNGYTKLEIEEYGDYIALYEKMYGQ